MSESEEAANDEAESEAEHDDVPTGQIQECQRCGREQGLVGKYDIWLCRQCFREISRGMGFDKYS
ncbi:30S ribosomal protein S14 [Halomicrobium salinisoli]|uniref:30S ribosomal protein S14 n=1 Tax=Halomicrobium salinisoli TaxID=2878391 RepID=UPI001CF024D8|nr:30S ribosomal protein S14 [Halomicrobium salinisoli]